MAATGITIATVQAQLAQIQTAIQAILLTGESYVRPGLSITRAQLPALQKREQYLIATLNRADGGIIAAGEIGGGAFPNPETETWEGR